MTNTPQNAPARLGWRELVAVVVGGMLGTGLRLAIDAALPHDDASFPWGTFLINVTGSFLLALLVSTLWQRPSTPHWLKAGLGVGTLGAFTTFSAVMVSLATLVDSGQWMLGAVYLAASVALGLVAAVLGLRVGHRPAPLEVNE